MIEYLALIFVLPLLDFKIIFLIFLFVLYRIEKKGIGFSLKEMLLYSIMAFFIFLASGKPSLYFILYMSYVLTLFGLVKLIIKEDKAKKRKEMRMLFGKRIAEELMLVEEFLEYGKKKVNSIILLNHIRGKRNYFGSLIKFLLIIEEKAKRKAIVKTLRD